MRRVGVNDDLQDEEETPHLPGLLQCLRRLRQAHLLHARVPQQGLPGAAQRRGGGEQLHPLCPAAGVALGRFLNGWWPVWRP